MSEPVQPPLTPNQLAEATRRKELLDQLSILVSQNMSLNEAADVMGIPAPTLCRWRKAWGKNPTLAGLAPKHDNKGMKPLVVLTPEQQKYLSSWQEGT